MYSEKQLIDFANFVLAENREKNLINPENKRTVTDADVSNWKGHNAGCRDTTPPNFPTDCGTTRIPDYFLAPSGVKVERIPGKFAPDGTPLYAYPNNRLGVDRERQHGRTITECLAAMWTPIY